MIHVRLYMKTPWWIHWYTAWLMLACLCGFPVNLTKAGDFVARHTKVSLRNETSHL